MPRLLALFLTLGTTACHVAQPAPPKIHEQTLSYDMPSLTALGTTEMVQTKGSITVAVTTPPWKVKRTSCTRYQQQHASYIVNSQYPYKVTTYPGIEVAPDKLFFNVRIVNQLDQVLRLAGTLVRFQIDGQDYTLQDQTGVKGFLAGVLAPTDEKAFTIYGPHLSALPDKGVIALMLYGVVTETDAAGEASKRENFEYYFRYESTRRKTNGYLRIDEVYLRPEDAPPSTCL